MTINRETYTRFIGLSHKLSQLAQRAEVANILYRDMGFGRVYPDEAADFWLLLDIKAMMKVASQLQDMYKAGEIVLEGDFDEGFIEEVTAASTFGIPATLVADIEWGDYPNTVNDNVINQE